jgi:hypothetical protein
MWFFLLGLNKIVRAEAHALELTRIMGHDGQTCMPGHANRGQRSSRRDLNLAGIGCPLGAVGPRLKRCTRAHGAVLQFPCLPRAKPTLVWAVSACLGHARLVFGLFRRVANPKSKQGCYLPIKCQTAVRVAWELQLALCCRWRSTGERLLPWSDTHNVPSMGLSIVFKATG